MSDWRIALTCPRCGAEVEHENGTTNGVLAVTIVRCPDCARHYEVTARLRPFGVVKNRGRAA